MQWVKSIEEQEKEQEKEPEEIQNEKESIVKKRDSKEIQVQSDGPEDVEIQGG